MDKKICNVDNLHTLALIADSSKEKISVLLEYGLDVSQKFVYYLNEAMDIEKFRILVENGANWDINHVNTLEKAIIVNIPEYNTMINENIDIIDFKSYIYLKNKTIRKKIIKNSDLFILPEDVLDIVSKFI